MSILLPSRLTADGSLQAQKIIVSVSGTVTVAIRNVPSKMTTQCGHSILVRQVVI